MKQIILGTAGHIDHGKTSLIKALTGTDTDRLKEEKARGITIELGFASIDLPSGQHVGIVDVPGHEKFVKNMVAGASGIDIVAMVIAADEGVMLQTKEHMEICTLLGIKHGLVVLTKTDMVDEEWLELVTDDIKTFITGTFLEEAPVIPVSSLTGQGIDLFRDTIDQLCSDIPEKTPSSLFRLPVDRVFSMKGFGTVITGTLTSGKINVGDTIMVYPSGITSKVRGIQVHNKSEDVAEAGQRTAINFQGLDKESVNRGDVVSLPETLKSNYLIDSQFHYLSSNLKPLKNRSRVRFHTGTNEIMGNLIILENEELHPGQDGVIQLRLDSPVTCVKDDKYVIRSYSPVRTIGGGRILNPIPTKHKRFRTDIIDGLKTAAKDNLEDTVLFHAAQGGYNGVLFSDLKLMTNTPDKKLNNAVQSHLTKRAMILIDKDKRIFLHSDIFDKLINEVKNFLTKYHGENPLKENMPKEELKSKLPSVLGTKIFNLILTQLTKEKEIIQEEDSVRLKSHVVALQIDQEEVVNNIIKTYKESKLSPPYFKAFCENNGYEQKSVFDILLVLVNDGKIIKVKDDLYFFEDAVNNLKDELVDYLKKNKEITTPQFKDMTGVSRKYVIPLIEYFDSEKVTIRVGDSRHLRGA